jgi:hypothetical protein
MITLDLSILNQKGTPMFYSDTLALRPAFGIAGRIFIAIDSPYGIFRDTGSAWVQIASGGAAGITGSGTINTIAMFTPTGTAIGDSAITQTGSNVTVTARNLLVTNGAFTLSHTHNPVNGTFNPYGEQINVTNTINAGVTWTALLAFFNTSSLQNNQWNGSASFGNGSYTTNNLNLSPITFNAPGATITSTQASGGIRAWANQILQLRIDGTNNGTYTHYANSVIYGDFAASTARFTITNRYGYLVNNLDEYSAGHTYTNRWAFYNAGINDNNFFAGKVGIGSGYTPSTFQLDVTGTARVSAALTLLGTAGIAATITSGTAIRGATAGATWYLDAGSDLNGTINIRATTITFPSVNANVNTFNCSAGTEALFSGGTVRLATTSTASLRINNTTSASTWYFENNRNAVSGSLEISNSISNPVLTLFSSRSVSLGSYTETTSAIFAISSNTKGFLPPRMTTAEKNAIGTPVSGLMVYDTTLNKLCVYTTTWETVTSI